MIKNKFLFGLGVLLVVLSFLIAPSTGWVTDDYAITISLFGLIWGLVMIMEELEEKQNEQKI